MVEFSRSRGLTACAVCLLLVGCRQDVPSASSRPAPATPSVEPGGVTNVPAVTSPGESAMPDAQALPAGDDTAPSSATASATTHAMSPRFLPLADAKVGEWCRYRMRDEQVEELRVVSAESGIVGIELKMSSHDKPLGLPTIRHERADEDPIAAHARRVGAEIAVSDAAVEAAGMRWPCRLVTETWSDEGVHYVRRTWYHEAAPVYGVVKMDMTADGAPGAFEELIDYGPR